MISWIAQRNSRDAKVGLMPRRGFPRKSASRTDSSRGERENAGGTAEAGGYALGFRSSVDKTAEMNAFWNSFGSLLGLGAEARDLTFVQISLRGVIVFLATLVMVRLGHKRSLSRKTAFDAVLIVILASVLSRAINGSAPFLATLGGGLVLVLLHRLLALMAYYSHWFGTLIKGRK